ncbi:DUF5082 family protein [Clostridium nigeriense]|uniref:YwqH-like family protein n=1 Tax=Clostridium nigeriense TaxID=1805470 RepID=UPI00082F26F4|nr:DUF5082 family protein [Clostridium nigeriense]
MAKDNSELIWQKQNQKYNYQSSRSNKQRAYDNNVAKLNRLYNVKSTLANQKSYANDRYKNIKSYVESSSYSHNWTGNKANKTKNNISGNIVSSYSAYVKSIDSHLDALCDEITRIENQNKQLRGDILYLGSLINSLANEIAKLFN